MKTLLLSSILKKLKDSFLSLDSQYHEHLRSIIGLWIPPSKHHAVTGRAQYAPPRASRGKLIKLLLVLNITFHYYIVNKKRTKKKEKKKNFNKKKKKLRFLCFYLGLNFVNMTILQSVTDQSVKHKQ